VFIAAQSDSEFAALAGALGREDLIADERFSTWPQRYANRAALEAELEPVFRARTADEWEADLVARDIGCARADKASHVRFLHSDPQPKAMGFMVMTQSPEFADKAPDGRYWRHAPTVNFSDTPCEAGKPYEGPATHTRAVLRRFGYNDATIDRLAADNVIAVEARAVQPIMF
jgi:crotonobetainyl-CoA:carnitine CoA-transferase CaiB-like acyl-CoA transferase